MSLTRYYYNFFYEVFLKRILFYVNNKLLDRANLYLNPVSSKWNHSDFTISSKCPYWKDVGTVSRVMFNIRFVTQYKQIAAALRILYSWYSEKKCVSIK